MNNTIKLLIAMIEEDKITIQEVLEACGYKVDVVCTDVWSPKKEDLHPDRYSVLIGYDEKIIAVKEFR